jgi:hypothetical protein
VTTLTAMKIAAPCPECGQMSEEPIERVATNEIIPCSIYQGLIDLSVDECREKVDLALKLAGGPQQVSEGASSGPVNRSCCGSRHKASAISSSAPRRGVTAGSSFANSAPAAIGNPKKDWSPQLGIVSPETSSKELGCSRIPCARGKADL